MEEKAKKGQGMLLISVVALLASFIIVISYLVPKISSLKDLANQVALKEQELETGKAKVEALKKATAIIKVARSEIETLGIAVPSKERADEAVAQIAKIAGDSGLNLQSVNAGAPGGGFINVTVSCEGSFPSVQTFLEKIEKNLRPVKVVDYTVASASGGASVSSTFNFSMPYVGEETKTDTAKAEEGATNGTK